MTVCYYCSEEKTDTRPYGPGGAFICYGCTVSTPERNEAAKQQFIAQMDAAAQYSSVVVIGEDGGVRPATGDELEQLSKIEELDVSTDISQTIHLH